MMEGRKQGEKILFHGWTFNSRYHIYYLLPDKGT